MNFKLVRFSLIIALVFSSSISLLRHLALFPRPRGRYSIVSGIGSTYLSYDDLYVFLFDFGLLFFGIFFLSLLVMKPFIDE